MAFTWHSCVFLSDEFVLSIMGPEALKFGPFAGIIFVFFLFSLSLTKARLTSFPLAVGSWRGVMTMAHLPPLPLAGVGLG